MALLRQLTTADFRPISKYKYSVPRLSKYTTSRMEEGSGRESVTQSGLVNCSQRAFRKFHLNTGLEVRGSTGFIGCINNGLC